MVAYQPASAGFSFMGVEMGKCIYCGEDAGWFRTEHRACRDLQDRKQAETLRDEREFADSLTKSILDGTPLVDIEIALVDRQSKGKLSVDQRAELLCAAWEKAVDRALDDGLLNLEEDKRLSSIVDRFRLPRERLDRNGALSRIGKVAVLKSVLDGAPQPVEPPKGFSVNIRRGEGIIWIFDAVEYLEDRVHREFVGRSQGMSFRVAKGISYRVGAFKGKPILRTDRVLVDKGMLVVTEAALYFSAPSKALRIPYEKIVSFDQFSDGLGVMRDAQTAKPQIFVTGDGWFTYNLVVNLAQSS